MSIHTGKLADRYVLGGRLVLRVSRGNGPSLEVAVRPGDEAEAGRIYGRGPVAYTFRGGRAFFHVA